MDYSEERRKNLEKLIEKYEKDKAHKERMAAEHTQKLIQKAIQEHKKKSRQNRPRVRNKAHDNQYNKEYRIYHKDRIARVLQGRPSLGHKFLIVRAVVPNRFWLYTNLLHELNDERKAVITENLNKTKAAILDAIFDKSWLPVYECPFINATQFLRLVPVEMFKPCNSVKSYAARLAVRYKEKFLPIAEQDLDVLNKASGEAIKIINEALHKLKS
jgi:hypothetical protein